MSATMMVPGKRIPSPKGEKLVVVYKGKKFRVIEPGKKLVINVLKRHVEGAKCQDPNNCVVARALDEALPYGLFEVQVGAKITKIFTTCGKVFRYRTSDALARGLRHFDKHKSWNLAEGSYDLLPLKGGDKIGGRPDRPENKKKPGDPPKYPQNGRPSGFRGRSMPTRTVEKLAFA